MAIQSNATVHSRPAQRSAFVAIACLSLAGVLTLGGCYERVVSAKGPGAQSTTIQQPYQEDSWLDRQVYGDPKPVK